MRILVHGASILPGTRMALAAAGLALRGHQVLWSGGTVPEWAEDGPRPLSGCFERIAGGLGPAWHQAEVVLGAGRSPLAAAAAGWMSRANALVLDLTVAELRRWDWRARWAWDSLHALGLVPRASGEELQLEPPRVPLERLAIWSDEPPAASSRAEHPDTEILERACERALARHRTQGARAAVFADRDGTLVVERGYLSDPEDLELLPGVPEAIHSLRAAGLPLVVISNQSGVGRGFFPLSRVYQAMARLRQLLRTHGAEIDAVYFCPHRPEAGCACRKAARRRRPAALAGAFGVRGRQAARRPDRPQCRDARGAGAHRIRARRGAPARRRARGETSRLRVRRVCGRRRMDPGERGPRPLGLDPTGPGPRRGSNDCG